MVAATPTPTPVFTPRTEPIAPAGSPEGVSDLEAPRNSQALYREQLMPWLSALIDGGEEALARFERSGAISLATLSREEIAAHAESSTLLFKEPRIHQSVLSGIDLSSLSASLGATGNHRVGHDHLQPVVILAEGDSLIVINGNHRVFKALRDNPGAYPLHVVKITSTEACEALFGVVPRLEGYPHPALVGMSLAG